MKNKDKDTILEGELEESGNGEPTPESKNQQDEQDPEQLRAKRDEYLELWKRAQADYKNLRRRGQADLEAGIRRSMQPLLDNLLLVLDHLDMALSAPTPTDETRNFAVGVQMTRDQLVAALNREDVCEIPTDGSFDPEVHQAIEMVAETGHEAGTIEESVRKGYSWRGVVLRYAQVRVAAETEPAQDEAQELDSEDN